MTKKIQTLQGLRGVAAILIVLSHYSFFKRTSNLLPDGGIEIGQNALMWVGSMGVSIFIILSGFVSFLSQAESYDIKTKVLVQYRRFLPLHIFTMILAIPLLFQIYVSEPVNTIVKFIFNSTMLHSWIPHMGIYYSFNTVSWYLGLAVFFTVATPFMIKVIKGVQSRHNFGIILLIASIIILQGVLALIADRIALHESIGASHWLTYVSPVVRFADFVIGGGIGCLYKERIDECNSWRNAIHCGSIFGISAFCCCIIIAFSNMYKSELFSAFIWTLPCLLIVFSSAIAEFAGGYVKRVLTSKAIIFFGEISFELFLWHQLVMRYVLKVASLFIDNDEWYLYLISLIISVVLSYGTHELVIRWNKRES